VKSAPVAAVLLAIIMTPVLLPAQPLESWHNFELPLREAGRFNTQFNLQLRTRRRFQDLYQTRVGTISRIRLANSFTAIAGFYYTLQESSQRDRWDNQNRIWGGIERPFRAGVGVITLRSLYEHWFEGLRGRDNRTRWLTQYRRPVGHGAVASFGIETFTDSRGYMAERLTATMARALGQGWSAELGYTYDGRPERVGGKRQMITTTVRRRSSDR